MPGGQPNPVDQSGKPRTWRHNLALVLTVCAGAIFSLSAPANSQPPAPRPVTAPPPTRAQTPAAAPANVGPIATGPAPVIDARPWPRDYQVGELQFALYRPEVDSWTGNRISVRAAVAVKTGETRDAQGVMTVQRSYGVAWLSARTETDKQAREVTLEDIRVDRVAFPTATEKEATYAAAIREALPTTGQVASLDQLESALAINQAIKAAQQQVNNTPPEIIVVTQPSVLVMVDGPPVWRPSGVGGVDKLLNSRAAAFRYQGSLYLTYGDHWGTASKVDGPWTLITRVPNALQQAQKLAVAAQQAPPANQISDGAKAMFARGAFPDVIVRDKPAELIAIDGKPDFRVLEGTGLIFVSNTPADVIIDTANANTWYVLISGRWFTAPGAQGPWAYVPGESLPASFKQIDSDGPKGAVLASIPGTPEATEALVANAIPQTATVNAREAQFEPRYDGAPQFRPLTGTALTYAVNSPTPVIKVSNTAYYALEKGVWFTSPAPAGPWSVALSVPPQIYGIPATSPLHYVTYVQVYGSSGDLVYVGYTPGYYGTVVADGVVVYGAGYPCESWVGPNDYYACPETYGYGATFGYAEDEGWGLAFGWGWDDYWYDPFWGPWYGYWPGYWGGAVAGNFYGTWGSSVVGGTGAAWANPWTGNYGRGLSGGYYNTRTGGRGYGYAGRNTNIYTGITTGEAGGVRYNPQTGRVVAGEGGSIGNIYTGAGVAGGTRTAVNTDTGRVTNSAGGASRSAAGATVGGGFNSQGGVAGDVSGAGYIHYDRSTGDISKGGVIEHNDNIYAGHDGSVYRKTDSGWEQVGGDGNFKPTQLPDKSVQNESLARDRAAQREAARPQPQARTMSTPAPTTSFNRGSYGGGYSGSMGGFRGGGFRGGGGFRR